MSGIDPERLNWLRENSGIRLDVDGRFWHQNEPVEHPGVIRLFRQGLGRSETGRPILRVGRQWCFIELEDVLFRVRAARCSPEQPGSDEDRLGACTLQLDDGSEEELALRPGVLSLNDDGILYARVRGGSEWARLLPSAQAAIGAWLTGTAGGFALRAREGEVPVEAYPATPSPSATTPHA